MSGRTEDSDLALHGGVGAANVVGRLANVGAVGGPDHVARRLAVANHTGNVRGGRERGRLDEEWMLAVAGKAERVLVAFLRRS